MTLNLPIKEKKYLKWYVKAFEKINYNKATPKYLENAMYKRTIEGMKKFGWSRNFVYQTFFVLGDVDLAESAQSKIPLQQEREEDCDCMYDLGCGLMNGTCNEYVDCSDGSDNDCGFFGGSDCEGTCI